MITLTSAVLEDLSGVRTWPDFATYLYGIHQRSGLRYSALQRYIAERAKDDARSRDLPSLVSDTLSGKRPIKKDLLESLLDAWQVPAPEHKRIVDAWRRLNATLGQGPANAGRFDEASPRELGVHPAIADGPGSGDLPCYVRRDFDELLEDKLTRGVDSGCFVILMGGSSCGKTRSLYEAVRNIVPDWWLVQPIRTQEIRDLVATPAERTVLWLDEFHRFLGADPPLRKTDAVRLVKAGTIVVGTLWPTHYFPRKRLGATDSDDVNVEDRRLLDYADIITVSDKLSSDERRRAAAVAVTDSRIEAALTVSDTGLTQVLAAGPDLVNSWEQAPNPHSKAIISAAADARRLGVRSPLPAGLLVEAMAGYLSPADRVSPKETWLDRALPHATSRLHGAVSALTPVAGS